MDERKNSRKGPIKSRNSIEEEYDPFDIAPETDSFFRSVIKAMHPSRFIDQIADSSIRIPDTDIIDNGDSFSIKIDMPGIDKEDIKLKVTEDRIMVKAEKSNERERSAEGIYAKERSSLGYYRTIRFPERVKADTAKAKLEKGTLSIDVDKTEKARGREIKVD